MDVKILKQFANESELKELKEWILFLRDTGMLPPNQYGPGRYYNPLGAVPNHPPAITRIKCDLQAKFNITGKCVDLTNPAEVKRTGATPSFIGMQTKGGFVQPHVDINIGEELQFRCTLLVSKPEKGGKLVLAHKEYSMDEGDVYCFVSNNTIHGSTPVKGNKPRMACSLGFIVDKSFRFDLE